MYNLEQNGITLQDFGFLNQFSSGFTAMTISYQRQTHVLEKFGKQT
jgi:hypothetical protein